jgi:hypothetical protein
VAAISGRVELDRYCRVEVSDEAVVQSFIDDGFIEPRIERKEWESWAWPGGYPLFYICKDSGVMCPVCANENIKLTIDPDAADDWKLVAADVNYEDIDLFCDHCNQRIEAAYGDPHDACDGSADAEALASAGHGTDEDYGSAGDML